MICLVCGTCPDGACFRLEWASYELVRVYNDLQTRDDPVDFYNFSAENLPDDVAGMMDVDEEEASDTSAEATSDEDDSDDDEDDEDFDVPDNSNVIMEVDNIEPAPEFVQGSSTTTTTPTPDATEEPNRAAEPPLANLTMPPSSIPPRFRNLIPKLPGLFSFHSGSSDQPQLTPDGLPFVGRGTPVDKRRRDDWANIRPASPRYPSQSHYTTSDEDWFSSLVTTPSILSGNTSSLSSDTSFGVPTEVGPFCCTQDGLYGSEGSLVPPKYDPHESAAGMSTDGDADAFDYPAPPPAWIQPPVRESTPFPEFPPQLTADFSGNAPEAGAFPPAPQTQSTSTGCILHSSLLECLTSGLGCVSGPFTGVQMQMQMPTPPPTPPMVPCNVEAANPPGMLGGMDVGPYDVAMEPVPVQASSALSHALG